MNPIDTTHDLISFASSNRNKISKIVINGLLLFIIFAVFGCFDFVNFSIDIGALYNWKYWTSVITKTIGGSIAFNIGINLLFDKEVEHDKELEKQRVKYNNLNSKKNELTFNYYVDEVFNREQKKKAYKSYINRKIYWLNKRSTNRSKLLYTNGNDMQKSKNRYCRKRYELETLKSDEYIDKNIDSIIVKYNKIDPIVFELELDGKGTYHGVKVKGNVNLGRTKLTSGVIMGMVVFSMITTSIILAPDQQQFEDEVLKFWHYVLVCCEDIGVILWQSFRGMLNARKLVSQELTEPLVGRNYVLDCYFQWIVDYDIAPTKGQQLAKLLAKGDESNV